MNVYRCYRCYVDITGGDHIANTVECFPKQFVIPALSAQDKATDSIRDLITMIRNPAPESPFLEYGPAVTTSIGQPADIFRTNETPEQLDLPATPAISPTPDPSPAVTSAHAAPRVIIRRNTISLPRVKEPTPQQIPRNH